MPIAAARLVALVVCGVACVAGFGCAESPLAAAERLAGAQPELQQRLARRASGFEREREGVTSPGWRSARSGPLPHLGVRLPERADHAFEVGLGRSEPLRVRFTLSGASPAPLVIEEDRAIYRDVAPATDMVLATGPTFLEQLLLLRDARSPTVFTWHLELPSGLPRVEHQDDGGLGFFDRRGLARIRVAPPVAVDANGQTRRAELQLAAGSLTVRLDPTELRWPVLLDPLFEVVVWEQVNAGGQYPGPGRLGSGMATLGDRALMYGGTAHTNTATDTWEWRPDGWHLLTPAVEPSRRLEPGLAPLGDGLVLFGGFSSDQQLPVDDTWEWIGGTWVERLPVVRPAARRRPAMARLGTAIILFGGEGENGCLADTWRWDGTTWSQLNPATSPPARCGPSLAAHGQNLVLFGGGATIGGTSDGMWRWDGTDWTPLAPAIRPLPRTQASMIETPQGILLFGGYAAGPARSLDDTWLWDGATWAELAPPQRPPARLGAAAAPLGSKAVIFGGRVGQSRLNDTWEWDGTTWRRWIGATAPVPRMNAAAVALGSKVVLFGGWNGLPDMGDTWEWDGETWSLLAPAHAPPAQHLHLMATRGEAVTLHGPWGPVAGEETWEWDGVDWTNRSGSVVPPPRVFAKMAGLGSKVILFGGRAAPDPYYADTWEWDGTAWSQLTPSTSPPARGGHVMVSRGTTLLLYGGGDGTQDFHDTWEWTGTDWRELTPSSGALPDSFGVAATAANGPTFLFAGDPVGQVWMWDGSEWSLPAATAGPAGRYATLTASLDDGVLLFGGQNVTGWLGDTWRLRLMLDLGATCQADAVCASGHCVDGVCCDGACAGTCERCDATGTCGVIAAGTDPENECPGSGPCKAVCDGAYACAYPGTARICGLCTACNSAGDCTSAVGDDPACGTISCASLDTACRSYVDISTNRCAAAGACLRPDATTCAAFTDALDGAACPCAGGAPGACLAGECVCYPQDGGTDGGGDGGGDALVGADDAQPGQDAAAVGWPVATLCGCRAGTTAGSSVSLFPIALVLLRRRRARQARRVGDA